MQNKEHKDIDLFRRVKPTKKFYGNYSKEEIDYTLKVQLGFKGDFSYKFIQDLSNAYSYELMLEEVKYNDPSMYFQDQNKINYHNKVIDFIKSVDFEIFPGNSPLEKALSIAIAVSQESEKVKKQREESEESKEDKGGDGEEGMDAFGGSGEGESGKDLACRIGEFTHNFLKANEGISKHELKVSNESHPLIPLSTLKPQEVNFINKLSIINKFSFMKAQKVSDKYKIKKMEMHSQINSLNNKSDLVKEDFDIKFIKKDLLIKEKIEGGKQQLILLIDDSGSMSNSAHKIAYLKAIMMNRFDAVCKNESELYVNWFVRNISTKWLKFSNKREVEEFLKITNGRYYGSLSGGTTNIENTLKTVSKEWNEGKLGDFKIDKIYNPEILLINDGQDSINPKFIPPIRTNAFVLTDTIYINKELKQVCENSKGNYVTIDIFK